MLSFQRQQDDATVFVLNEVDEVVVRELGEELIYRLVLPVAFDDYVLTRGRTTGIACVANDSPESWITFWSLGTLPVPLRMTDRVITP